jgi:hypothetical protein
MGNLNLKYSKHKFQNLRVSILCHVDILYETVFYKIDTLRCFSIQNSGRC